MDTIVQRLLLDFTHVIRILPQELSDVKADHVGRMLPVQRDEIVLRLGHILDRHDAVALAERCEIEAHLRIMLPRDAQPVDVLRAPLLDLR